MKQMSDRNNAILKKIKGLLAIANDNKSDEESLFLLIDCLFDT